MFEEDAHCLNIPSLYGDELPGEISIKKEFQTELFSRWFEAV